MIRDLRQVAETSGIPLTRLVWNVDSCVDGGQGNLYQSTVTGSYPGGGSVAGSRELITGWQRRLAAGGWSGDSGAITHNGIILAKDDRQLEFIFVDPAAVDPVPPFAYNGPCRPLDGDPDSAPGDLEDVTAEVMS